MNRDGEAGRDATTAATGVPTPDRLGPYRILERLGSGAMGAVYRAEDEDAEIVALKVLHPHLLERGGFFKRFGREARAGRKVDHRNVVRTLDADLLVHEGTPCCFLVMEYVEGRTLRALLRDLGTVPEALAREIALQMTAGLAAIHEAGLVHRDLKPENVLITKDHEVRIMDLGVAKEREASFALTQEGQFAGSLLYAAPEQFRHGEVGPASDLYALGVLLYELTTGTNPFRYDDLGAITRAHLEEVPSRANERNPELSAFHAEVLTRLLEKAPDARFGSAAELHAVFEEGEASAWWQERQGTVLRERAQVPRVPVRRETELHGREADLALLRQAWDDAKAGDGRVVLLEGEAGIGKSRLVDAFLQGVAGDDVHVLYGSYPPSGGMGGLSDAVIERFGAARLENALRPYLESTRALVPAFAAVLRHEPPPEGRPPVEGDALHAVFCHLMRGLSVEKPVLWVVEDLHFARADSREIVLSLARAAEGHRVLLLTTTRPGLPEAEIAHFSRLENFRRSSLARLGARDVVFLLRDAFRNRALADKLAAQIAVKSDGIPFFVFEMIRGLKEGQFLTELPDGSYVESKVIEEIEVPSAVKDLITVRLRDLNKDERAILDVGAVQAFAFDPDLVARTLERPRVAILQDLAEIERRSGVVRAQRRAYHFDHHQIQEVLYAELPEGLRAEYHTLLAEAFTARNGDGEAGRAESRGMAAHFLAFHHLRGVRPRRGLPALDAAFAHLVDAHRRDEAIGLGRLVLETEDLLEGPARVHLLFRMSNTLSFVGRQEEQRAVLEEAVALADDLDDVALRAKALRQLGWLFHQSFSDEPAHEVLTQALELARAAGDGLIEAEASGSLGCSFESTGNYDEARRLHERQLALGRALGDRWSEETALGNLGWLCSRQGEYREGRRYQEQSLAIARETDNVRGELISLSNLARVHWDLGNYDEARRYYEQALGLAKTTGCREAEATAHGGLGTLLDVRGHFAEARKHYERQIELAQEMGDLGNEMSATANLGLVLDNLGRYEEALACHHRDLAFAREHQDLVDEAIALVNLGDVLSHLGRQRDAEVHLAESLEKCRASGLRRVASYALHRLGQAAERRGVPEEAMRRYEEALALRRELGYRRGIAETLLALGRCHASRGRVGPAAADLDEALALGRELDLPEKILLALAHRALLPGGDPTAAREAWNEHAFRVGHALRMEARYVLWRAIDDPAHLEDAKRLLDHLVEHAPEEYRESMLDRVPLHREILESWKASEVERALPVARSPRPRRRDCLPGDTKNGGQPPF